MSNRLQTKTFVNEENRLQIKHLSMRQTAYKFLNFSQRDKTGCKLNFSQRGCRVHFLPGSSPEVKKFPKEEEAHHAGEAISRVGNGVRKPMLK